MRRGTVIVATIENIPQNVSGVAVNVIITVVIGTGCISRPGVSIVRGTLWIGIITIGQQIIVVGIQIENPGPVVSNTGFWIHRHTTTVAIGIVIIVPVCIRAPGVIPVVVGAVIVPVAKVIPVIKV